MFVMNAEFSCTRLSLLTFPVEIFSEFSTDFLSRNHIHGQRYLYRYANAFDEQKRDLFIYDLGFYL